MKCQETVYDDRGEIERETCGEPATAHGMCDRCRNAEIEFQREELHQAEREAAKCRKRILDLGGGL